MTDAPPSNERDDDESLPPEVQDRLTRALRVEGAMPDLVWARLERALHEESVRVEAKSLAPVVELSTRRRRAPIFAGVAAAAVVLVAAGLIIPGLQGSDSAPVVVAVGAPAAEAPAAEVAAGEAAKAASSVQSSGGSMPARQVMASGADYRTGSMQTKVDTLVDTIGASRTHLLADVTPDTTPTEGTTGFTSTIDKLRACIGWLTRGSGEQALVVDRAYYGDLTVGVVVVPAETDVSSVASTLSTLEVWVVKLDCDPVDASVLHHDMITLSAE